MSKLYVGDEGTEMLVDTGSDLSTATLLQLKVKQPDGTTVSWTGSQKETTKITYTIQAGEFAQAGKHYLQAYVESPTWTGLGDTVNFALVDPYE
jgi:hypothetical protein